MNAQQRLLRIIGGAGALVLLVVGWNLLYGQVLNVAPYEQKVVLITGTASGIGKATAERLIAEGHIVYGGDIQVAKNRYLEEIGGHSLAMDVTDPAMVEAGVLRVIAEQGRIDVLFNNAGFGLTGAVEDVTMEDARYQMDVNVFGYAHLIKAVAPYMRAQGKGLIINNSSTAGRAYSPLGAWYHASKYAVEGLSDALRLEMEPLGIEVVILEPGFVRTNFSAVAAEYVNKYSSDSAYQWLYESVALAGGKIDPSLVVEPSVVAEAVGRILRAKNPDTRYLIGPAAKAVVYTRELLGDQIYDWLLWQIYTTP